MTTCLPAMVSSDVSHPIDLNDVRLMLQVVRHGNFALASTATGIAKSTISQRVAALERALGGGLLRRTPRRFSLTEAGERLLPHAQALDEVARRLEASLPQPDGAKGMLRASCPMLLSQAVLPRLLPRFFCRHEPLSLAITVSDGDIDPVTAGLDLTIRHHVSPLKDSSLLRRVAASLPWTVVASPGWLNANPAPCVPGDIPASALLTAAGIVDAEAWTLARDGEQRSFARAPRLNLGDMLTLRALAIAGAGVSCLPAFLLQREMQTGRLVALLPDWHPPRSIVTLLLPPGQQSSPFARLFADFLASELPSMLQAPAE